MVAKPTLFRIILPVFALTALLVLGVSLLVESARKPDLGDGNFDPNDTAAIFLNQPVAALLAELSEPPSPILGIASDKEKWIEVDLTKQKLVAWQGNQKVIESLVSSGKWNRTPVGEYRIWAKVKYQKMSGGSQVANTYYYLPNVPYTMYFYKDFGLHGTYWHTNFGQPMSHGCVNLPTPIAEKLFYWSDPPLPLGKKTVNSKKDSPGTRVVIHI